MRQKRFFPSLAALLMLLSCNPGNRYSVQVTVSGESDPTLVLNHWYVSSDTLTLQDGLATFSGKMDTFPALVSLGFPFPSQITTRMILEPGEITVQYAADKGFQLGGTENNKILQTLFNQLQPWEKEVRIFWKAWNEAYNSTPRLKDACEQAWLEQETVKIKKEAFTKQLIRENPNYAGLVITLPLVRTATAEELKFYVDHFKQFEGDRLYQSITEAYEIADRTINGKPVPPFSFPDTAGQLISLSDFKGKWVLLDFWYVDCPWCRKMTPHLRNIYADWKESKNLEIISISVDKPQDFERWKQAILDDGAPWTQVNDSTKTYPLEYGITGYPTLILVDPQGNGVLKMVGYQEEGGLRRLLKPVNNASSPANALITN